MKIESKNYVRLCLECIKSITKLQSKLQSKLNFPESIFPFQTIDFGGIDDCPKVSMLIKFRKNIKEEGEKPKDEILHKFLRCYDISQIKEHRVLRSFTIGRKIKNKEICDNKISKDIESFSGGECVRVKRIPNFKYSKEVLGPYECPIDSIFNSNELHLRTLKFYQRFAGDLVDRDFAHDFKTKFKTKESKVSK